MRRSKISRSAIDPLQAIWSTLERTWYPRCSEFERTLSVTSICTVEVCLAWIRFYGASACFHRFTSKPRCAKRISGWRWWSSGENGSRVLLNDAVSEWAVFGKARGRVKERRRKRNSFAQQWQIHIVWILWWRFVWTSDGVIVSGSNASTYF